MSGAAREWERTLIFNSTRQPEWCSTALNRPEENPVIFDSINQYSGAVHTPSKAGEKSNMPLGLLRPGT